jgi:hypothetical protein
MIDLGLVSIALALLCLAAERRLHTRGLLLTGALLAFLSCVTLLVLGVTDGVPAVLAASAGVCVASVGGVFLLARRIRRARRTR